MLKQHYQTDIALGCRIELVLVTDEHDEKLDYFFRRLWLYIFKFEQRFSRFLPDSELSKFNRSAGSKQWISPEFRELLTVSGCMSEASDGLYNPFVLPAVQRAGYVHSMLKDYENDVVDDFSNRSIARSDELKTGPDWAEIPYGTAIDSGGIGKGFAGDKLADMAENFNGVTGYWFSLGGDIIAGGHDDQGKRWDIYIKTSEDNNTIDGKVHMKSDRIAVATSSATRRSTTKKLTVKHIIDPRTGEPATSKIKYATVCAPNLKVADVLASSLIIGGAKTMEKFINDHTISGAMIQSKITKQYFGDAIRPVD